MARNPETRPKAAATAQGVDRRAVLLLGAPAAGAAALAGGLLASRQAAGIEAGDSPADDRGDTLTPHREAYYRRARF